MCACAFVMSSGGVVVCSPSSFATSCHMCHTVGPIYPPDLVSRPPTGDRRKESCGHPPPSCWGTRSKVNITTGAGHRSIRPRVCIIVVSDTHGTHREPVSARSHPHVPISLWFFGQDIPKYVANASQIGGFETKSERFGPLPCADKGSVLGCQPLQLETW